MNVALHAIARVCNPVAGGLKQLLMIDPNDLSSQPVFYLVPNIETLSFKPGKTALVLEHDRFSAMLESDTDVSNKQGDIFTYSLQATVKGIRLDVEYLRQKLMNRRIHMVAKYWDGTQQFLPYVRLRAKSESGKGVREKNQYTFTAQAQYATVAPLLQASLSVQTGDGIIITPPGTGSSVPAMASITTSASSYTYTLPAGKLLVAIFVKSTAAQTIMIGKTSGGAEIAGPVAMASLTAELFGAASLRAESGTPIYFTGLAGTNTLEIWTLSAS